MHLMLHPVAELNERVRREEPQSFTIRLVCWCDDTDLAIDTREAPERQEQT